MNGPNSIKVIHAVRSLEFGGAEKMVLKLSVLQKETGHIFPQLVCVKGGGELSGEADRYGLHWTVTELGGVKYLSPILRLRAHFSGAKPDIVHTHNLVAHLHAAPAARLCGIPVIHTKHGRAVSAFSRFPGLRRWVYNLADRIAVVSDETGESFIRKTGVNPKKVVTVYNGIDQDCFHPAGGKDVREEFGIGADEILFGSLSRLSPEKDHKTMIQGFSEAVSGHENCRLLIVGDGPLRGQLERLVSDLSLNGKVIFAGFREDTTACLDAMDIFLQPSLEEGLSLTILEAAAAGVPVITTPVGGTPEIIVDRAEGIMVEPGNREELGSAMRSFLNDRAGFERMAEAARRKVRNRFSLSEMEKNYRELYRQLRSTDRR